MVNIGCATISPCGSFLKFKPGRGHKFSPDSSGYAIEAVILQRLQNGI